MSMISRLIFFSIVVLTSAAWDSPYYDKDPLVTKGNVFEKVNLPGLTTLLQVTKLDAVSGRDPVVRAQGSFVHSNVAKIIKELENNGFVVTDAFLFASGDDNPWWKLEQGVSGTTFLDKQLPGHETKMKLFALTDGSGFFQFEDIRL
ncbi:hypothetical protein [Oryzifoliimicrobium ureilyticus]|uniref:hypothetical protein n=1 Tax=Oryzifoliimicrobium ureilyticus TaxID=3113724 RepID=UPI00307645D3